MSYYQIILGSHITSSNITSYYNTSYHITSDLSNLFISKSVPSYDIWSPQMKSTQVIAHDYTTTQHYITDI